MVVDFSVKKKSYASMLGIAITDYDSEIPNDEGKKILNYVLDDDFSYEPDDASLVAVRLLRLVIEQISADVKMRRDDANNVHIDIAIPQLAI